VHSPVTRTTHWLYPLISRFCMLAALLLASISLQAAAQTPRIYAYNNSNSHLVSFSADAPGTLLTDIALTGLAGPERVVGMDFAPRSDELYGVAVNFSTNASRMVKIDRITGAITTIAPGLGALAIGGGYFGISISSFSGLMYITNGTSNVTAIPTVTSSAANNTSYAYAVGDVSFGVTPIITNLAHTPSVGATQPDTLYGISPNGSAITLVRIGAANGGTASQQAGQLSTIGPLGVGIIPEGYGGFDIQAGTNTAYAALRVGPTTAGAANNLYTVNLTTGAATLVGVIGPAGPGIVIDGIAISAPNPCLDVDGDGIVLPTTDGLILTRALLGMTGAAVLNNAQPTPAAARTTWTAIRDHLNTKCGMNFGP
jgi:trimeric autotransporter adhesin